MAAHIPLVAPVGVRAILSGLCDEIGLVFVFVNRVYKQVSDVATKALLQSFRLVAALFYYGLLGFTKCFS